MKSRKLFSLKSGIIMTLVGGGLVAFFWGKNSELEYHPHFDHGLQRPYPTEYLFKVVHIEPMQPPKRHLKSASILEHDFRKRISVEDLRNRKSYAIATTEEDFVGIQAPAVGDTYAAFGLAPDRHTVVRMVKYEGPESGAAREAWFEELR